MRLFQRGTEYMNLSLLSKKIQQHNYYKKKSLLLNIYLPGNYNKMKLLMRVNTFLQDMASKLNPQENNNQQNILNMMKRTLHLNHSLQDNQYKCLLKKIGLLRTLWNQK